MMLNIYQRKEGSKNQLYTNNVNVCCGCGKEIFSSSVVFVQWINPPDPHLFYSHFDCAKKVKKEKLSILSKLNQMFIVQFVTKLPKGCFPIIIDAPNFRDGNLSYSSLFDEATIQRNGEKIINKTRHSFRESWEGTQIGSPDVKDLIEEKDKDLSLNEGMILLDSLKSESKQFLDFQNKKFIEGGSK